MLILALLFGCGPTDEVEPEPDPTPAVDDDDSAAADDDDDDSSSIDPDPTWRSALYPADWTPAATDGDGRFLHDFSYAGYARGEALLPAEQVGPIADAAADFGADPTGAADSTAAIQAAIDSLPDGGTVWIPAGDYRVDGLLRVEADGVVVSGQGAEQTRIWFTRLDGMSDTGHLTVAGSVQRGEDLLLASDGEARAHDIELADASSLQIGDEIAIGWVITDDFVEEHAMTGTWQAFNGQWRAFFRREVTALDGNLVSVDIPLRYAAQVRDSASVRVETGYRRGVGVQDLAVSTAGTTEAALAIDRSHAIDFIGVADGWIHRVASFAPDDAPEDDGRHLASGGIKVLDSKRVTVAEVELGHAQNRGGGGNGYLFEISRSGEVLIRDSVGTAGRHNFIQNWDFGTSGCVWLRTTSRDGFSALTDDESFGSVGLSEYHHSLAMANLVDDSIADDGWGAVNRHDWSSGAGHSATENVFWNVRGADGSIVRSFQFGHGYVIGTDGVIVEADVAEDGLFSPGEGTEPNDWVEGLDEAATLEPASLYEDQLARRLAR